MLGPYIPGGPALTYYEWLIEQGYIIFAAGAVTEVFLKTFKGFPPRRRAASFTIDQAMEKMKQNLNSH
jgi:arylsulfatase